MEKNECIQVFTRHYNIFLYYSHNLEDTSMESEAQNNRVALSAKGKRKKETINQPTSLEWFKKGQEVRTSSKQGQAD